MKFKTIVKSMGIFSLFYLVENRLKDLKVVKISLFQHVAFFKRKKVKIADLQDVWDIKIGEKWR